MSCNHCCCRTSSEVYNHIKTAVDTNNYYVHINMDIYRVMIWLCFRLMMFWINWVKVTLLNYYTSLVEKVRILLVRFIYSEKDTNFYKISTVDLSNVVTVKSLVEILQTFGAFSENMNFIGWLFDCRTQVYSWVNRSSQLYSLSRKDSLIQQSAILIR